MYYMEDLREGGITGGSGDGLPYPRWVEVSVVVGFFVLYSFFQVLQGESVMFEVTYWGLICLQCPILTLFLFRACRVLTASNVGWAKAILGHLVLMFVVTACLETIMESGQRVLLRWLDVPPPEPDPTTLLGVIRQFQFVDQFGNYTFMLIAGLSRGFFLRYTNKQARLHELQQQAQRLQTQLTSARLEALRMQINPHFLFNTLHVINTMAGENPEGVCRATKRLSELLRYVLSSSDKQEMTFEQELQFLRGYLEIQKLRLKDQLRVEIDVNPATHNALVPTLLLQPLAENAVKHGVQQIEGTGRLRVVGRREGREMVVRVEDNGPGFSGDVSRSGKGLKNIRERLARLYGSAHTVHLGTSSLGGSCVEVRLPHHTEGDPYFEAVPEGEEGTDPSDFTDGR